MACGQTTPLVYKSRTHLPWRRENKPEPPQKIQRYKREKGQMSHHVQAILVILDGKSEPGLSCLHNGRNAVLFSPCDTFIHELLFDAVWLVVKFMIPSLQCILKYNIFQKG